MLDQILGDCFEMKSQSKKFELSLFQIRHAKTKFWNLMQIKTKNQKKV
jgi:hypothetical protein